MIYNIVQERGNYQTFRITLKDNVFTFYDYGGYEDRNISTIKLIIDGLKTDEKLFIGKSFDIRVNTSDQMRDGMLGYSHETDIYKTIPCFTFDGWRQVGIDGFETTVELIKNESMYSPIDDKLFWAGSVSSRIQPRVIYEKLSKIHTDLMVCNSTNFDRSNPDKLTASNFVSLPEHCKWKYLIDIEGVGWSGRLKFLCFTKRLLFINDRPYKEFWMNGLVDGENCIILKRDLSDLVDKLLLIKNDEMLYKTISNNLYKFAEKNLNIDSVNKHIIEVFKRLL